MTEPADKKDKEDTASTESQSKWTWRTGPGQLRRSGAAAGEAFPARRAVSVEFNQAPDFFIDGQMGGCLRSRVFPEWRRVTCPSTPCFTAVPAP